MDFFWPGFLLLLGLIPLTVAAYIWMLRRRRRFAVRYSSLALVREALPQQSRLRRHLPFAFFLLALVSLVLALGRPVVATRVGGIPEVHSANLHLVDNLDEINRILEDGLTPVPEDGIIKEYSLEHIAGRYEELFRGVAHTK